MLQFDEPNLLGNDVPPKREHVLKRIGAEVPDLSKARQSSSTNEFNLLRFQELESYQSERQKHKMSSTVKSERWDRSQDFEDEQRKSSRRRRSDSRAITIDVCQLILLLFFSCFDASRWAFSSKFRIFSSNFRISSLPMG